MANFPWCHFYLIPSFLYTTATATNLREKVSRFYWMLCLSLAVSRQTTQCFPFINCSEIEIVADWKYLIGFVGACTLHIVLGRLSLKCSALNRRMAAGFFSAAFFFVAVEISSWLHWAKHAFVRHCLTFKTLQIFIEKKMNETHDRDSCVKN